LQGVPRPPAHGASGVMEVRDLGRLGKQTSSLSFRRFGSLEDGWPSQAGSLTSGAFTILA
jgi:hypothetical protein